MQELEHLKVSCLENTKKWHKKQANIKNNTILKSIAKSLILYTGAQASQDHLPVCGGGDHLVQIQFLIFYFHDKSVWSVWLCLW